MIIVYTGDGKGKTTAAVGSAARAAGRGKKVAFIQFLKETGEGSGEAIFCSNRQPAIEFAVFGKALLGEFTDKMRRDAAARVAAGLARVKELAAGGEMDLLVLDEVSHIINLGLASIEDVSRLLRSMPEGADVVLTGRDMPEELIEAADLVTEMRNVRHPFDGGEPARFGIEY